MKSIYDEFINGFVQEREKAGDPPEEIDRILKATYTFIAQGLFAQFKNTKKKDLPVLLDAFSDSLDSIIEKRKQLPQ